MKKQKALKLVKEAPGKYKIFYEASRDAMMMLVPEGGFLAGNPAAIKMFGCNNEKEFISHKPADLSPQYQPDGMLSSEKAKEMMSLALKNGVHFFEWKHKSVNGKEFDTDVSLTRMELKGKDILQAVVRNINKTSREKKKLEKKVKEKSRAISFISHELKNPLAIIKESLSLILDGIAGGTSDKQRQLLGVDKKEIDRLVKLINQILDAEKLDSEKTKFNFQENDINAIVVRVKNTTLPSVRKKGLKFITELNKNLPKLRCDKDKIVQVFINLITNAIKFTEKGSITVCTSKNGKNAIRVSVRDTGQGIQKKELSKVFKEYEQGDSAKQDGVKGMGLGLSISRDIIEKHNGKIWAESKFGKGTTFYFVMPLCERRG